MKTAKKKKKCETEILKTSNLSNKIISSSAQSRETIPLRPINCHPVTSPLTSCWLPGTNILRFNMSLKPHFIVNTLSHCRVVVFLDVTKLSRAYSTVAVSPQFELSPRICIISRLKGLHEFEILQFDYFSREISMQVLCILMEFICLSASEDGTSLILSAARRQGWQYYTL